MTREQSLRINLTEAFGLSVEAAEWLVLVFEMTQFFDDLADGDSFTREELDKNIYYSFIGIHKNPFFAANSLELSSVLENCVLKWQASDVAEKTGRANEKSFVWRASFYDLVLSAAKITHGFKKAQEMSFDIMNFYGENIEEYYKEFKQDG